MTITGADGDDTLNGSVAGDALSGGNGSDTLSGEGGSDTLTGAAGDDTLTPGLGDDNLVDGGTESDRVSYDDGRSSGVTVTLNDGSAGNDGGPDDGAAGSREAVVNTESLVGSAQADVLTGDGAFNTIDALAGNDSIRGGVGQDDLNGSTGTDTVDYGDHGAPVTDHRHANEGCFGFAGEPSRPARPISDPALPTVRLTMAGEPGASPDQPNETKRPTDVTVRLLALLRTVCKGQFAGCSPSLLVCRIGPRPRRSTNAASRPRPARRGPPSKLSACASVSPTVSRGRRPSSALRQKRLGRGL